MSNQQRSVLVLGFEGYADPFRSLFPEVQPASLKYLPKDRADLPSLLLFTGGEDLSPALYGAVAPPRQNFLSRRCQWELAWYTWALRNKVPMFGTCRGIQFFTAMTGGTLIQHVDNHIGGHPVTLAQEKKDMIVNSIHHQMCIPNPVESALLAYARRVIPERQWPAPLPSHLEQDGIFLEPEALFFPEARALGVQWHPEGMSEKSDAHNWVLERIEEYLL